MNELFSYKVCINLDRRADRWQQMQSKFLQHDITGVRRFSAVDGAARGAPSHWPFTPGAYGCLLSHVQVVREARASGIACVLIFEDDVVFADRFQEQFNTYKEQLPSDWDMVFFGVLHLEEPIAVSDNVVRIRKAYSTYAYALNHRVFDPFIELNSHAGNLLDKNNFLLQEHYNCYCFTPHLAWVEADYSDAQERLENHWYLQDSLVLFGGDVNRLLAETAVIIAHHSHPMNREATQNLIYLVHYYHEFFSRLLSITVVEQGSIPTIDPGFLPPNCRYLLSTEQGPFNRWHCFVRGLTELGSSRKFYILSDSDIYIEPMDIRANLRKCEQYDAATGFARIVDLNSEDTRQLHRNKTTRGLDISAYGSSNNRHSCCCIMGREALRALEANPSFLPLESAGQLRVFESPNHALRLHQGSGAGIS